MSFLAGQLLFLASIFIPIRQFFPKFWWEPIQNMNADSRARKRRRETQQKRAGSEPAKRTKEYIQWQRKLRDFDKNRNKRIQKLQVGQHSLNDAEAFWKIERDFLAAQEPVPVGRGSALMAKNKQTHLTSSVATLQVTVDQRKAQNSVLEHTLKENAAARKPNP